MTIWTVVTDLDGTLTLTPTGLYNSYRKFPWWVFLGLIFVRPNEKMIEVLRGFTRNGDRIIILSARPPQLEGLTKWWLKIHRIPFNQLFLVGKEEGVAERKLEIIKKMKVKEFFDDDPEIVDFLKGEGINAKLP